MAYSRGRARLWWEPRNRRLDRLNFLMPAIPLTTVLEYPPDYYCIDAPPPPYSLVSPFGRMGVSRDSFIPPVFLLSPEDADDEDGEAQPSSPRRWHSEPALAVGGPLLSWPRGSSSALSLSDYESRGARPRTSASVERGPQRAEDAEEPCGVQPRRSASVGLGPRRDNTVSAPPYVHPPPYSVVDPYAPRAPSAALGSPQGQLAVPGDTPPRGSATASPAFPLKDPPSYNVVVSSCPLASARALDRPSAAQSQLAAPGAPKSPPGATAGAPILESVMEAEELDLPPPGL